MRPRKRVALAAGLAMVALATAAMLVLFRGRPQRERSTVPVTRVSTSQLVAETTADNGALQPERKPLAEHPIEEVLAESGEDPAAVYYMSRVREALNEGNPEFARELFRQMKEEHEKSILVEEAERLFED